MLLAHRDTLAKLRIVLASQSPRRAELMKHQLGLTFSVLPSKFEENLDKKVGPQAYVEATCRAKALEVWSRCKSTADVLISADTIVVGGNEEILEKPKDKADAVRMLKSLSKSTHRVLSGVTIVSHRKGKSGGSAGAGESKVESKSDSGSSGSGGGEDADADIETFCEVCLVFWFLRFSLTSCLAVYGG